MKRHRRIIDRNGKTWSVSKVRWEDAERADFRFWYDGLTPEERVEAVAAALESCLKTRGQIGIPRLRRVHRRIESPSGAVSHRRRPRSRRQRGPASRS